MCRQIDRQIDVPQGRPTIKFFQSKLETEIFSVLPDAPLDYNLSKEEWLEMRGLAEKQNNISVDQSSSVVVWDREDYFA